MYVIWLADSTSPHVERWQEPLQALGIEIKVYSLVRRRPRILYFYDLISIVVKMRKEPSTIIHAHFASSYGVLSSFLPSRFRRVVSVWGSDILVTPKINCLYRSLVKRALVVADVRIANSEYLAKEASKVADLPYETIPFGLNLDEFPFVSHSYMPTNDEPFVIGIVKRLHKVAGVDLLLKAFASAVGRVESINLRLLIVGTGPEEENLKSLARELGIADSVSWKGWCGPSEVSEMFGQMHLAVFPSRVEGLGVSVIEAMASGAPVLVAEQGGLVELVGDNEQRGSLFELNSLVFSDTLIRCVLDYEPLLIKARLARDYVEQRFDIRKNAVQLADLYKDLN